MDLECKKLFFRHLRVLILFLILILVVPIFFISDESIFWINNKFAQRDVENITNGLNTELEYISKEADELAVSGLFNKYIVNEDVLSISSLVTEEARTRQLSGMLVTDKDGVVLSRFNAVTIRGDYIFNSNTWADTLLNQDKITIIEKDNIWPLIMISAQYIKDNDDKIGIIGVGHVLNDDYIKQFSQKYIKDPSIKIAFYSKEKGMIASGFTNIKLPSYSISANEILRDDNINYVLVNLIGRNYFIKKIPFSGIEESQGGIIIFLPINTVSISFFISIIVSLFFLFIFLLYRFLFETKSKCSKRGVLFVSYLFVGAIIIIFILTLFTSKIFFENRFLKIEESIFRIYNSVLELQPQSAILNPEFEHQVTIKLLSGGEAINSIRAIVNYDPDLIKITDIITTNSLCQNGFYLEKEIDNNLGKVIITCVLPNPGFLGRVGKIADLVIQPLKGEVFSLTFDKETQVLANDGLGSNVLRDTVPGSYQVIFPERELLIFSKTHPNSERWYNSKEVIISWWKEKGNNQYSYFVNQSADPIVNYKGTFNKKTSANFSVSKDGIYYFHLLIKNEDGGIIETQYKIKVDTIPPDELLIGASHLVVKAGEVVKFTFRAVDKTSGVESVFFVSFDGGIFLPVGSSVIMPFMDKGYHSIKVRVFDRAGNYKEDLVKIKVE